MKTRLLSPQPTQPFKQRDDMKVDTFARMYVYLNICIYLFCKKLFFCKKCPAVDVVPKKSDKKHNNHNNRLD